MKKIVQKTAIILALLILPGCFQVDTVIKVNRDGSGTVEETMLVSKKLLAQMNEMMQGFAGKEGNNEKNKAQFPDIYDPVKLKAKAAEMGSGVTYTSGKKIISDKFVGYQVVYAFTDINKLSLNQNRSEDLTAPATIDDGSDKKPEKVMFRFSKGSPATLTIRQPEDASIGKAAKVEKPEVQTTEDKNLTGANVEQFKEMMGGLKFSMTVEVSGNIVQTNATHHEGSRITVMEMDFDKLLENPEQIARLNRLQPKSFEDVRELARNIPGMKVDLNKELVVKFK